MHSGQPCVCETWHIQSTEGQDFRQSISQTTITYTPTYTRALVVVVAVVGRSTNSKISALFIMFKLGQFECHEIEKCSQNWDYRRVWGRSTNFHCDRTHNCTCTRFLLLLLLLLFFVCCFYFWVFRFSLRAWKKELQPWRSRNPQCEPNWGYSTTTGRQPDELTFQTCMWVSVCVCICIRAVTHVTGSFIHS